MSDLMNCPFCGEAPKRDVTWGIEHAICQTEECCIHKVCIPVGQWNRRSGRSISDVAPPSTCKQQTKLPIPCDNMSCDNYCNDFPDSNCDNKELSDIRRCINYSPDQ